MIKNKEDLSYYLSMDAQAQGRNGQSPCFIGDYVWKYLIALRHKEYWYNTQGRLWRKLPLLFWKWKCSRLGRLLGFEIPVNVCGYGLKINHSGLLIINEKANIGNFCSIHQGVIIGEKPGTEGAPQIGANVYIGPGAKIFGNIQIADNIKIGANSVVNKSFLTPNVTIVGVPAHQVHPK